MRLFRLSRFKALSLLTLLGILIFFLASCSNQARSSNSYRRSQYSSKPSTKKENDGTVDARTLRKSSQRVKEIEVGKTYIAIYPQYSENVWEYIKLIDNNHYLFLEDVAHRPRSYYVHTTDDKVITVMESTYRRDGDTIRAVANQREVSLVFDYRRNVQPGIPGKYDSGSAAGGSLFSLVKNKGGYIMTNSDNAQAKQKIFLAKHQLPNSIDEYMKEYKLTPQFPNGE